MTKFWFIHMYMLSNILFFVKENKKNVLKGKKIVNNVLDPLENIT